MLPGISTMEDKLLKNQMIINDIASIMSIMKNANFEDQEFNETVTELKNSFFYGSRNNLFFKYLGGKNISENEFTVFLEKLRADFLCFKNLE